jgi:Kdo2-lipid IVA lauroyltransferase/acyltransferase
MILSNLVSAFFWSLYILPRSLQKLAAYAIAFLWHDILRLRRQLVRDNIRKCFPAWTEEQVHKIGWQSFLNQGTLIVDFANMLFMKPENILKNCTFENRDIFDRAIAEKKGVLLLGSHLSNGDYGIAALAQSGLPLHLVAKRFTNKSLDRLLYDARLRFGTKSIAPRNSSFDILKALKKNEVVIFVLDQFMGPPLGVSTTFFGHPTGTAMGLALFAERTKAPVLPCYAYRKNDGSYCVRFEEAIPLVTADSKDEFLQKMTQVYNDKLELVARKYPGDWLWLHRRWKVFQ